MKFDGYRIQARLDHGEVRLLTRKGLDWTAKFPNVAAAIAKLPADTALIDGEIVVEEHGVPSFSALQAALKDGSADAFVYYAFDLLYRDGRDLRPLPLGERKDELADLVGHDGRGTIRFSEHFTDSGARMLAHACAMGLEGIVSKKLNEPYRSGRSEAFVKIKCSNAQELVVGGYAPSNAQPNAIGALVVGVYDDGELHYAGRVGTGYTQAVARDLWKRLHPLEIDKPPFHDIPREERRAARWVKPTMVIEANLGGWTADGLVRQAAFKGVREDKPAREVVREVPAMASKTKAKSASKTKTKSAKKAATKSARAAAKPARPTSSRSKSAANDDPPEGEVRFTNPDRVYWPDVGITKQQLADYYRAAWDWMAPYVVNRPLSLVRCPDGMAGECFFQKHASAGLSEAHLRTVIDTKKRQIIAVEDLDGLLSLVQAGVLEVHVRGSMLDSLDRVRPHRVRPRSGRGRRLVRDRRGGARRARPARRHRSRELRQAVGRQGAARGGADRGRGLGHGEDLRADRGDDDGARCARPLSRQDDQGQARRPHLHRLFPQLAGADVGRGLLDPRARRRAGVGAGDLGGTGPHQGRQPVHGAQSGQAPGRPEAGPVAGHEPRAPVAAEVRHPQAPLTAGGLSLPSPREAVGRVGERSEPGWGVRHHINVD